VISRLQLEFCKLGKEGEEREAILYAEVLEQLRLPQAGTLLPLTEGKGAGTVPLVLPGTL
jgi:hypothetical protein